MTVVAWDGPIDQHEAERHLKQLAADPDWGVQGLILTDLTGMDEASLPSEEQLRHVATTFLSIIGDRVRHAKWAVIADVSFEDATKFSEYVETGAPRLIVFNDFTTACAWLGVDEAEVHAILEELRRE